MADATPTRAGARRARAFPDDAAGPTLLPSREQRTDGPADRTPERHEFPTGRCLSGSRLHLGAFTSAHEDRQKYTVRWPRPLRQSPTTCRAAPKAPLTSARSRTRFSACCRRTKSIGWPQPLKLNSGTPKGGGGGQTASSSRGLAAGGSPRFPGPDQSDVRPPTTPRPLTHDPTRNETTPGSEGRALQARRASLIWAPEPALRPRQHCWWMMRAGTRLPKSYGHRLAHGALFPRRFVVEADAEGGVTIERANAVHGPSRWPLEKKQSRNPNTGSTGVFVPTRET